MTKLKILAAALLAALILCRSPPSPRPCPISAASKVVVVTENAYPPLQFVDPQAGKPIGWEYDAMDEIAKRLNFKVEYQNTSWDAMIQAVSDKQYDIGMTGITIKDDRKEKVDFSDPYMRSENFMLVRGDESRFSRRQGLRAPTRSCWSAPRPAPRPSTSRSTTCSTATSRTRASSCSRPSRRRSRR